MCYVAGMRCILVLGAALLLVAASITPIRVCGSLLATMGMAIGPTTRRPTMAPHTTATMALSMAARPIRLFAASQRLPRFSAAVRADARRAAPDAAGTASRGAATTSRRRTDCLDASARWLAGALRRLSAKNEQVWRPTGRRGHVVAAAP